MKKLIAFIAVIALSASMVMPAYACTPKLNIPSITIPKITKIEYKLPQSFWDNYFRENPLNIDLSGVVGGK
jgi:hypothetical protein